MGTTTTVITIYIIVAVALALVNVQIARLSFRRSGEIGRFLGYSALLAAVINITYLCSALIHTYIYVSIFSSIYFICIDWFLIALVHFVILYTNTTRQKYYTDYCIEPGDSLWSIAQKYSSPEYADSSAF